MNVVFWIFNMAASYGLLLLVAYATYFSLTRMSVSVNEEGAKGHRLKKHSIVAVSACAVPIFIIGTIVIYYTSSDFVETTGLAAYFQIETDFRVIADLCRLSFETMMT